MESVRGPGPGAFLFPSTFNLQDPLVHVKILVCSSLVPSRRISGLQMVRVIPVFVTKWRGILGLPGRAENNKGISPRSTRPFLPLTSCMKTARAKDTGTMTFGSPGRPPFAVDKVLSRPSFLKEQPPRLQLFRWTHDPLFILLFGLNIKSLASWSLSLLIPSLHYDLSSHSPSN